MSAIRLLQILALAAGAAAFAPYAGPDLEKFDFEYQGLRIAGSKPRGREAPAVVFLPYGIIPYETSLEVLSPAMEAVAQRGFAVALVAYPDIAVYPDAAGAEDFAKGDIGRPGPDPQFVQRCPQWLLRAGRDRSLAGRSRVRVALGDGVRPLNAYPHDPPSS